LIKEVPDPDGVFNLDADGRVRTANLAQVPSLFDENAAEAAVRLKENCGGRVVAICCGPPEAERTVRYAMAIGADESVLVVDSDRAWDSLGAASILAAAVTSIEADSGTLRVRRMCEGGEDLFSCTPPLLLTVSSEANRPRYPSVMKVMAAKKKPIQRWKASELDAAAPIASATLLGRYTAAAPGNCELISGDTPDALAAGLLSQLREKRVI